MSKQITNPVKAIRAKCLDCCETTEEVKHCHIESCALHPFRFGTNPFRAKRKLSEEQKRVLTERLSKARGEK